MGVSAHAQGTVESVENFHDENGNIITVITDSDVKHLPARESEFSRPEHVEIGDIILTEEGYQRVIAVNEIGAFLTESAEE